mmetsp:Transcript_3846/g.3976  ORF Transcript_3846/g.3976 Transcript_3846/m.3976 type:complete len:93 (-) Transcript_3846:275-553(-)
MQKLSNTSRPCLSIIMGKITDPKKKHLVSGILPATHPAHTQFRKSFQQRTHPDGSRHEIPRAKYPPNFSYSDEKPKIKSPSHNTTQKTEVAS